MRIHTEKRPTIQLSPLDGLSVMMENSDKHLQDAAYSRAFRKVSGPRRNEQSMLRLFSVGTVPRIELRVITKGGASWPITTYHLIAAKASVSSACDK